MPQLDWYSISVYRIRAITFRNTFPHDENYLYGTRVCLTVSLLLTFPNAEHQGDDGSS
jgi:hypothetical protein